MYSVIESGGFQHKITLGESVKVAKIEGEPGSDISISKVLLHVDGENITVGTPFIPEGRVTAEILQHGKGDKVKVFKRKRRKGYRRTQGHRQLYTEILIKEFSTGSVAKKAEDRLLVRARARIAALAANKSPAVSEPAAEATEN